LPLGFLNKGASHIIDFNSADIENILPHRWIGESIGIPMNQEIEGRYPSQVVQGEKYEWHITPYPVEEEFTFYPTAITAIDKINGEKLTLIDPTYYKFDMSRTTHRIYREKYPTDTEALSYNVPPWKIASSSIPYYAYPQPLKVQINVKSSDRIRYQSNDSELITECLVLAGGLINQSNVDPKNPWIGTNTIMIINPTLAFTYTEKTSRERGKWEPTSRYQKGLLQSWIVSQAFTNTLDNITRNNPGSFGGVVIPINTNLDKSDTKSKFMTVGGLYWDQAKREFYPCTSNTKSYCYEINCLLKFDLTPIDAFIPNPDKSDDTMQQVCVLTSFHQYTTITETKSYVYLKNDMRLGSENTDTGFIDNNTYTNAWPLFFPRAFNLNITDNSSQVFHLYSSMGLENGSIKTPDQNIQYSAYLKNYSYYTFNAAEAYWLSIGNTIYTPVATGHPLNLSGGIGALDGCVPVHDPTTNNIYLLGGRQLTNKDNINNTFTNKEDNHTIEKFDKLYTQPYGMRINKDTTNRMAVRQPKSALTEFDIIDDVLPYAALYSDALYIEKFKAWLVPTTALTVSQDTDLPPMLMLELFDNQTNKSLQIETSNTFIASREDSNSNLYIHTGLIFRITPLFTKTYGYVQAIKNSPNIDIENLDNRNTIGRNWGDHFIYIDDNQDVCYVNLATQQAFKITQEQMTFTDIEGHIGVSENTVSLRLEPES
jgi:hypothetical protein